VGRRADVRLYLLDCRWLGFDYEYQFTNSEGMIWVAATRLMLNRIWPPPEAW
jgi:hypothetical protein